MVSLSLLIALVGVYSHKTISLFLPLLTCIIILFEGGIKNISLRSSPPLVFLTLLLFWSGLSIFWAENQIEALKTFITLTFTFIFSLFFFACMLNASSNLMLKAYSMIKISGAVLIFCIISQI